MDWSVRRPVPARSVGDTLFTVGIEASDMSGEPVGLEPVDESDLPYVETLLAENDLPCRDVRSKRDSFSVAVCGDERVGVGGVEVYGTDGLLRSIVVERSARDDGVGSAICTALERRASTAGVDALYLLTTTAAGFFARQGYDEIERADAPGAIRETAQFSDLCPATATCMRKSV